MQNRLITFGCSFTYGHGLEDCFTPPDRPGNLPSRLAWPSLLSIDLNLQLTNLSKCGSSNLEILWKILEYKFLKDDLVIIMWSFADRDLIFQDGTAISIGAWNDSAIVKHWSLVHTTEDLAIRSWLYMHHAQCYLSQENIKFYNIFANYHKLKDYKKQCLKINYLPHDMSKKIDYALDNSHPGPITHRILADCLRESIHAN
jgi:hypothetical protein